MARAVVGHAQEAEPISNLDAFLARPPSV